MKDLVHPFLDENDQNTIRETVKKAEKTTAGEIVPMVVSSSYHYPVSNIVGGFALSFPLSLVATYITGTLLHFGADNLWLYLAFQFVFFGLCFLAVKHSLVLKRLFVSDREIDEEVQEEAITRFHTLGLQNTRDRTGILIFISVFEHKVWVLADKGINDKVDPGTWDDIVAMITQGFKDKQPCDAICRAIDKTGAILATHFPIKADDENELDNLIIGD